jgi:membrane-associated phospholipid phosphatase
MTRRPGAAGAAGAAGIAGLLVVWLLAFHSSLAMAADRSVLDWLWDGLHRGRIVDLMNAVPRVCDPVPFAVCTTIILAVAIACDRPRSALAAGVVLVGANLTTHLLKPAVGHWRDAGVGLGSAAWPSGHATASMTLALCAIIVAPAAWRPLVAVSGLMFTLAVGFTLVAAGWHFPSDVVGGYLVAGTWTAFAVAGMWSCESRRTFEDSEVVQRSTDR